MRWRVLKIFLFVSFSLLVPYHVDAAIDVPFKSQVPPGQWGKSTVNCGQTSVAMMLAFLEKREPTAEDIIKIDDWLYEEYGDPVNGYNGTITDTDKLTDVAQNYGGYTESYYGNGDLEWLRTMLSSGQPVIVGVHINMDTGLLGHFMVALELTDSEIVVHDPGKTLGAYRRFPVETFLKSWKKQNNAYTVIKDNVEIETLPNENVENPPQLNISELTHIEQTQKISFMRSTWNRLSTFFIQSLRRILDAVSSPEQQEQIENANSNVLETQTEEVTVPVERVYSARFVQREIPISFVKGAKQVQVSVEIENTGAAVWEKNTISLNVVGGRTSNAMWYHPTWVTQLRPVIISQRVEGGQKATVSFTVTIPEIDRQLRLQLVRPEGGTYVQVGTMLTTVVLSEVVVPPVQPVLPTSTPSVSPPVSRSSDEDVSPDTQTESTAVVTPFVDTPSVFVRSGGRGRSQDDEVFEGDEDTDVEEEVEGETPTSTDSTPTSTDPTPTSTPTSTDPVVTSTDPLPELSDLDITNPVDPLEVVYTNESEYVFAGTSDEYTEVVVVTKDDVVIVTTTPSGGVWEVPIVLTTGTQSFVLYGTASEGRQTSSTTIIIVYDTEAPFIDVQLLSVGEGSIVVDLSTFDDSPVLDYVVEFFEIVAYSDEEIVCEDGLLSFEAPRLQYFMEGDDLFVEVMGTDYGCGFVVETQDVVERVVSASYDQSYVISVRAKGTDAAGNQSDWWYSAIPLAFPDIGDVEISL